MERYHRRHADAVEQSQDLFAGRAAENAELVLHPDCVGAARLDRARRLQISLRIVLRDRDDVGGVIDPGAVIHRVDVQPDVGKAGAQARNRVVGEGRDAAAAR